MEHHVFKSLNAGVERGVSIGLSDIAPPTGNTRCSPETGVSRARYLNFVSKQFSRGAQPNKHLSGLNREILSKMSTLPKRIRWNGGVSRRGKKVSIEGNIGEFDTLIES